MEVFKAHFVHLKYDSYNNLCVQLYQRHLKKVPFVDHQHRGASLFDEAHLTLILKVHEKTRKKFI